MGMVGCIGVGFGILEAFFNLNDSVLTEAGGNHMGQAVIQRVASLWCPADIPNLPSSPSPRALSQSPLAVG